MNIQELTQHPELMNRETLYELRRITAQYPYYQPARLLLLKNLYLLHDPSFDDELRQSAIYFTDRSVLFNLIETAHYRLKRKSPQSFSSQPDRRKQATEAGSEGASRTVSLIDSFLNSSHEIEEEKKEAEQRKESHRKPTAIDATVDYVAYLLATDFEELEDNGSNTDTAVTGAQSMNGNELIDAFIKNDGGRFTLQEEPDMHPEILTEESTANTEDDVLTETLAGIYIKQGRYQKALDVINRLSITDEKKSAYVADQQRFLKKLISITNKK